MKLAALIAALVVSAGTGIVMMSGPRGTRWSNEHVDRLRGTEAFYQGADSRGFLGPFEVRLRGSENEYLVIGIFYDYRAGLDSGDISGLVAGRKREILDAITLTLGDEHRKELENPRGVYRLKRRLRSALEAAAFPNREGRIDRLLFDPFIIQRSG